MTISLHKKKRHGNFDNFFVENFWMKIRIKKWGKTNRRGKVGNNGKGVIKSVLAQLLKIVPVLEAECSLFPHIAEHLENNTE